MSLLLWILLAVLLAVLVTGGVVAWLATRKPTEDQVRKKVRKIYARYRRKHPDLPEGKLLLGVLTARLPTLDWETRRQMAHAAGDLDQLVETIVEYEFRARFRQTAPGGFGLPGGDPQGPGG